MEKQKKLRLFLAIISMIVVAMYVYCSFFVFFAQDDVCFLYINKTTAEAHPELNQMQVALLNGFSYYFTWQGTYLTNWLIFGLVNLYTFGMLPFHIFISCVVISFFGSLFFLQHEIAKVLNARQMPLMSLVMMLFVVLTGMNVVSPAEIFYWIIGVVAYALPFSLGLWGCAYYIKYKSESKNRCLIAAGILGFLACGGSTIIGPMLNAAYLFVLIMMVGFDVHRSSKNKECKAHFLWARKKYFIMSVPFWCVFVGTLINVLAPGNFVRKGTSITDQSMWLYVIETLAALAHCLLDLLTKGYLAAVCMLCVAIIFLLDEFGELDNMIHPAYVWAYSFLSMCIVTFPVVLGYGNGNLSDRTAYMIEFFISVIAVWLTTYTSMWLKQKRKSFQKKHKQTLLLTALLICAANLILVDFRGTALWTMRREIKWGTLSKYYSTVSNMWEQIDDSTDIDVELQGNVTNTNIIKKSRIIRRSKPLGKSCICRFFWKKYDTPYTK